MANIICIAILILVVGSSCLYIIKQKKKGNRCIGCPCASGGKAPCSCCKE